MSIQYLKKQAYLSPAFGALLGVGAGVGAGSLWDFLRTKGGNTKFNWTRNLTLGALLGAPSIAHGIVRGGLDTYNGEHQLGWKDRWLTSDQEYEKNPIVRYNLDKNNADETRAHYTQMDENGKPAWKKGTQKIASGFIDFNGVTPDVIPVNSFNQTTWLDASRGRTPLETAGFVTNTLNATNNRVGGGGFVTPGQVIGTLVNAGIGYGTSWLTGKALGAMAGISPASQAKICQIGTWGGMLSGLQNNITSNIQ